MSASTWLRPTAVLITTGKKPISAPSACWGRCRSPSRSGTGRDRHLGQGVDEHQERHQRIGHQRRPGDGHTQRHADDAARKKAPMISSVVVHRCGTRRYRRATARSRPRAARATGIRGCRPGSPRVPAREQQGEQHQGRPVLTAEGREFRHARRATNLFIALIPLISSPRISVRLTNADLPVKAWGRKARAARRGSSVKLSLCNEVIRGASL
jgi:hypothetical protein